MEKRARILPSASGEDKDSKGNIRPFVRDILVKDHISGLPRDILVGILSQLKTKEVGRTSILSRVWRYMWTAIYNLDFDASELLDDLEQKTECLEVEQRIYISCVNEVIRRHQGQTIDQFVVVFSLDESSGSDIDQWVSFAISKRVQMLKLDLLCPWIYNPASCYSFPDSLEISRCNSLTSLHLAGVNITGEVLELLLCNCLNLESVFLSGSMTLVTLKVSGGPLLKLKTLDLHYCYNIKHLKISAPNLVSFKYTGPRIRMPFRDVPRLVEISIMGLYSIHLLPRRLSELSRYLSQLDKFTIGISRIKVLTGLKFPLLPKLKQLTLIIRLTGFENLLDYTTIISACPSLYKFSLEVWCDYSYIERDPLSKVERCPPLSIKVVELIGFRGKPVEIELAMHLIENCVMLEKITFDVARPPSKRLKHDDGNQQSARERARQLGKKLHPGVQLVII